MATSCTSTRSSMSSGSDDEEDSPSGTLFLVYAVTIRLVRTSKMFLLKKKLGRVALSCRFALDLLFDNRSVQQVIIVPRRALAALSSTVA